MVLLAQSGPWNLDLDTQRLSPLDICCTPFLPRLLFVHVSTLLKLGCHLQLMSEEICPCWPESKLRQSCYRLSTEVSEAHLQEVKQIFIAEGRTALPCFLAKQQSSTSENTGGLPDYTLGIVITYNEN